MNNVRNFVTQHMGTVWKELPPVKVVNGFSATCIIGKHPVTVFLSFRRDPLLENLCVGEENEPR